jgi:hypothetical protein
MLGSQFGKDFSKRMTRHDKGPEYLKGALVLKTRSGSNSNMKG